MDWKVLLIGGHSGSGKTIAARRIGLSLGIPWMMADDLRLAFARARVTLPEKTEALYVFEQGPPFWRLRPEAMRDALIAIGEVMSAPLEVIVENHADHAESDPIVIEGEPILPSLYARPSVRERVAAGAVRAVFLVESDESAILENISNRARPLGDQTPDEQPAEARAKWLLGKWLAREAKNYDLPVIEPRPWETLDQRIAAALEIELPDRTAVEGPPR